MNTFEFSRKLKSLNDDEIRKIGIESVHINKDVVISDAIVSNAEGLTFGGNQINETPPFKDWEETGEFHENLRFRDSDDIEFTSSGEGFEVIFDTFDFEDIAGPTAKILSSEAMGNLRKSFIEKIKKTWQN